MIVIKGILVGLTLAALIGPVFFTLIKTSLQRGFDKAIWVALGISLSDLFYILVAHYGLAVIMSQSASTTILGYLGGGILIVLGIYNIIKPVKALPDGAAIKAKGRFRYVFKGFAINGISPFVLMFWLGTMSMATVKYAYWGYELIVFFGVILLTIFITDILKAYLALKIRKFLTPQVYRAIGIGVGFVLILFGLRMFFYEW